MIIMSILSELGVTSVASTAWLNIDGRKLYVLQATGLLGAEAITIHIETSTGDEAVKLGGEFVQLKADRMMIRLTGPAKIKLVKTSTLSAPRVELFEQYVGNSHLFIGG
jgi:hypothetical protein